MPSDDDSELGLRGSEDESPEGIDILNILCVWYRCVFKLYSLVLLYIYNVELGRFFFISREKQQADLADRIP